MVVTQLERCTPASPGGKNSQRVCNHQATPRLQLQRDRTHSRVPSIRLWDFEGRQILRSKHARSSEAPASALTKVSFEYSLMHGRQPAADVLQPEAGGPSDTQ